MSVTREVELKFELDTDDIDRLVAAPAFATVAALGHAQTSTYFDTSDQALRKAGLSLRIRAIGKRRIQTVKAESASAAGLFARREWEMPIDGDRPVLGGAGNPLETLPAHELQRLEPIFQIVVTRQTRNIEQDGAKIELVLDQGEIIAGCRTAPICEVELELQEGSPAAVFALARALDAVAPLQLSALSKAQLGYRLLDESAGQPVGSTVLPLTGNMTPSDGFEVIAHACIRQFRFNQSILARMDSPEALHQARVALRRLRSALSIFEEMLAGDRFEYLLTGLRWIARELDMARNLDVLLERLPDATMQEPLRLAREQAYAAAKVALVSPRLRTLMLALVEWITIGNWRTTFAAGMVDQRLDSFAAAALDRYRRRVKRRGRHWGRLDDEARHKLRLQAKKLRYAADFFGLLFPGKKALRRHKGFLQALRALQTSLGDLNDRITGAALLTELGLPDGSVSTMAGQQAEEREAMLEDASEAFDLLVDARIFWR